MRSQPLHNATGDTGAVDFHGFAFALLEGMCVICEDIHKYLTFFLKTENHPTR